MLFDELKEHLKSIEPHIATIKAFWENAHYTNEIETLAKEEQKEDFWQHPKHIEFAKRLQALRDLSAHYESIIATYQELGDLIDLFSEDESELQKIRPELFGFEKSVKKFKISLLLNEAQDSSNCFLSVNAGAGGTESQDWTGMLFRMYLRFCEQNNLQATAVDYQPADEAGIKSATLFIQGKNPYGLLKSEIGIHRLVRISPFDSNQRRHTSFAGVSVTPEVPDIEVTIDPKDLRIDTYRASGAGGQHVNKTDSAVRITHFPTGIVVQCQSERSQIQNRETAMKMLKAKIAQKYEEERAAQIASQTHKKKIEWGSQIRSYVLHPYKMVKDHRTSHESPQPDLVLDGEIMPFIESYLVWQGK
jgi:peptide chain release factor 2